MCGLTDDIYIIIFICHGEAVDIEIEMSMGEVDSWTVRMVKVNAKCKM